MRVVDNEKSERGLQRRTTASGRLLHCCCICGILAQWSAEWSAYCSVKDLDDCAAIPKFCSESCRKKGGTGAVDVTEAMKRKAKDAEWRDPETVYRDATPNEKYWAATRAQRD